VFVLDRRHSCQNYAAHAERILSMKQPAESFTKAGETLNWEWAIGPAKPA
jgi:hypothetical protein